MPTDSASSTRSALRKSAARLLLIAALVLPVIGACGGPDPDEDAARAYCLATAQRIRMVEAAVAIGAADPGSKRDLLSVSGADTTLEAWRAAKKSDFDRTCDAIRPAQGPNELVRGLMSAATLIIGALLALGSALVTHRLTRRRQVSDALRDASQRLARSVDVTVLAHTGKSTSGPSAADLLDRVSVLEAVLRRARSVTRRDAEVDRILTELAFTADLLATAWPAGRGEEPFEHGKGLRAAAANIQVQAEGLAADLDEPLRRALSRWWSAAWP